VRSFGESDGPVREVRGDSGAVSPWKTGVETEHTPRTAGIRISIRKVFTTSFIQLEFRTSVSNRAITWCIWRAGFYWFVRHGLRLKQTLLPRAFLQLNYINRVAAHHAFPTREALDGLASTTLLNLGNNAPRLWALPTDRQNRSGGWCPPSSPSPFPARRPVARVNPGSDQSSDGRPEMR
jgi:hypothetical protein